jgi:hypothetical protein
LTYEELILAIANDAPKLSEAALRVLLGLVATGIESGVSEVVLSKQRLADRAGLSREGAARGTRELHEIVTAESTNGVHTVYTMPADWFTPQRSLFAVAGSVENRLHPPTIQAGSRLVPRQVPANEPGGSRQRSRQEPPGSQAAAANEPGRSTNEPGSSYQLSRQVETQNQQLTDDPLDRSNRVLSSVEGLSIPIGSIERVNHLPSEFYGDAEELKRWLRGFFAKHHTSHTAPTGPDEIILAKCLAIAPLPNLVGVLQDLNRKGTRPGDTWAWFVTVFCQRIHRTKNVAEVKAPEGFQVAKKTPSSEGRREFAADLLQEVAAGVRTL